MTVPEPTKNRQGRVRVSFHPHSESNVFPSLKPRRL
jgi:hypothetical protein